MFLDTTHVKCLGPLLDDREYHRDFSSPSDEDTTLNLICGAQYRFGKQIAVVLREPGEYVRRVGTERAAAGKDAACKRTSGASGARRDEEDASQGRGWW